MQNITLKRVAVAALLVGFVAAGFGAYRKSSGDDLSSGYIACRLIAEGQDSAVYAHHPEFFHIVMDPAWSDSAARAGFRGFLHPYVQTPLWASALQPLCTRVDFATFNATFSLLALIALAGTVWLAARSFTGSLAPILLPLGLAWLWLSLPFDYGMTLTQTHALFVLATLGALILAEREREPIAGVLLALAAAVKVTPALLMLYWLATRRRRAVAWFLGASAALALLTWLLAGTELTLAYVASMERVSNVLLVAFNNHSLAAWLMASEYPAEVQDWRMLELPAGIKLVGLGLAVGITWLAGWLRQRGGSEGATVSVALLAMTMFAPIAWSHYYIVLAVPLIWMLSNKWLCLPAVLIGWLACLPHGSERTLLYAGLVTTAVCIAHVAVTLWRRDETEQAAPLPST